MTELTEAQRREIEENRRRALEKLQSKSKINTQSSYFTTNISPPLPIIPAQQVTSRATQLKSASTTDKSSSFFQKRSHPAISESHSANYSKFGKRPSSQNTPKTPSNYASSMAASRSSSAASVSLELHSRSTFTINDIPALSSIMKSIPGFSYLVKERKWVFPLSEYANLLPLIKDKLPNATFYHIPQNVLSLFLKNPGDKCMAVDASKPNAKRKRLSTASTIDELILSVDRLTNAKGAESSCHFERLENIPFDLTLLDEKLRRSLLPFQLAGLRFALEQQGRILLADDMGLGKTIQSLAIASFYRIEWPLLIIVPASLIGSWTESIFDWMPSLERCQVNPLYASTIQERLKAQVPIFQPEAIIHILSYDFAVKQGDLLRDKKFQVIICDESHFLRNPQTKRCKVILPLLKRAGRVILLSGTPALSRPIELFTQIMAIRPKLFPNMVDYGTRYCAGHKTVFGWDFKGADHTRELSMILENTIMLRRLKAEVLTQLPSKRRQHVFLQLEPSVLKKLKALGSKANLKGDNDSHDLEGDWQANVALMQCWRETGLSKLPAIQGYLADLFMRDTEESSAAPASASMSDTPGELPTARKYIIFAHHQQVLDGLEDILWSLKIPFIRIDGTTPVQSRHERCQSFQDPVSSIRVAILSMTAAGVGLTLTAASMVIFTELFWNPGVLIQAEDRAHRIGQKDSVLIQYLLAKETTDDTLWPLILKKLNVLESVGLTKNEFYNIERTDDSKLGKFENSGFTITGSKPIDTQKSILEFIHRGSLELRKESPGPGLPVSLGLSLGHPTGVNKDYLQVNCADQLDEVYSKPEQLESLMLDDSDFD